MRVLVCPGPLAGNLSPTVAADAIARGWRVRSPGSEVATLPLSDGDGALVDVVHAALGGELVGVAVPGPLGEPVPATLVHVSDPAGHTGGTVVVEAGQAIGRHLVAPSRRAEAATAGSSEGLGRLLAAAADRAPARVVVGVGVAAVHDAGAGLLRGLGLPGGSLGRGAEGLAGATDADLDGLDVVRERWSGVDLLVACATDEPLVGLSGAGAALARRAGVEPARAQQADAAVARFADLLARRAPGPRLLPLAQPGRPDARPARAATSSPAAATGAMTGAGGGTALALRALGGRLVDGADALAGLLGLDRHAASADLLVTACERLDADAVHSGVVARVGEAGLRYGVPVVVIAGDVDASRRELARIGVVGSYALRPRPGPFTDPAVPAADPAAALAERASRVAATWAVP